MLVERFLNDVSVISGDTWLQLFSLGYLHDPIEILSSYAEPFDMVNWLIQELRALVVQTRVIIDN
jgi:hypothetical protein